MLTSYTSDELLANTSVQSRVSVDWTGQRLRSEAAAEQKILYNGIDNVHCYVQWGNCFGEDDLFKGYWLHTSLTTLVQISKEMKEVFTRDKQRNVYSRRRRRVLLRFKDNHKHYTN